ncbi:hypothetical protein BG006_001850, partial [Podila minutissima]
SIFEMFSKVLALLAVAVHVQDDTPQVITLGDTSLQAAEAAMVGSSLMKRASVYDGCRCSTSQKGSKVCHGSNVYQCAANGDCCNFGYRTSCDKCGEFKC